VLELVVGLLVTAGLAPVVRAHMVRRGFLDVPNHRSSHLVPVPRAGGLACVAGVVVSIAVASLVGHTVAWAPLAGAVALSLVGLADDRADLLPLWRLAGQAATGALVGLALGSLWFALAGLVLYPPLVNATNFMDGINGITGLTMTVWGVSALAVGLHADARALEVLGGATAGVALGFLPFNAPTARLFLGDVGSYLFGALAAGGILLGWSLDAPVAPLAAPLAIYVVDTGAALVRRALRGEPLTQAHREHVYQQLTSGLGISHLAVAGYAAGLAAVVAVAWHVVPGWEAVVATVALCAVYLASPRLMAHRPSRRGVAT
jgi:UDP-N-acetylmuramyl pentapeptide phosphotransferase/UDP-N-acetylglucosamine-1-phosphate transferase